MARTVRTVGGDRPHQGAGPPRPAATLGLACFAVLAFVHAPAEARDYWMTDPITDCRVWSEHAPGPGESLTWSGPCVNGIASGVGVLVVVEDGRIVGRFHGALASGKAQGHGKLWWRHADEYLYYEGGFVDSTLSGEGYIEAPDGARYEGDMAANLPHGEGMYRKPDGSFYQGGFVRGVPEGEGIDGKPSGERYRGTYVKGLRSGTGALLSADGWQYIGEFSEGEPDGKGKVELPTGAVFEGVFVAGEPQGAGVLTEPDGSTLTGTWRAKAPEGRATLRRADGSEEVQIWKDGERVQ